MSKITVIKVERNEDDTIRYVKYARMLGDIVLRQKAVIARIGGIPVLVTLESDEKDLTWSHAGEFIEEADLVSYAFRNSDELPVRQVRNWK